MVSLAFTKPIVNALTESRTSELGCGGGMLVSRRGRLMRIKAACMRRSVPPAPSGDVTVPLSSALTGSREVREVMFVTPVAHQGAWLGTGGGNAEGNDDIVPICEHDGVAAGALVEDKDATSEGAITDAAEGDDVLDSCKLRLAEADADSDGDDEYDGDSEPEDDGLAETVAEALCDRAIEYDGEAETVRLADSAREPKRDAETLLLADPVPEAVSDRDGEYEGEEEDVSDVDAVADGVDVLLELCAAARATIAAKSSKALSGAPKRHPTSKSKGRFCIMRMIPPSCHIEVLPAVRRFSKEKGEWYIYDVFYFKEI